MVSLKVRSLASRMSVEFFYVPLTISHNPWSFWNFNCDKNSLQGCLRMAGNSRQGWGVPSCPHPFRDMKFLPPEGSPWASGSSQSCLLWRIFSPTWEDWRFQRENQEPLPVHSWPLYLIWVRMWALSSDCVPGSGQVTLPHHRGPGVPAELQCLLLHLAEHWGWV